MLILANMKSVNNGKPELAKRPEVESPSWIHSEGSNNFNPSSSPGRSNHQHRQICIQVEFDSTRTPRPSR